MKNCPTLILWLHLSLDLNDTGIEIDIESQNKQSIDLNNYNTLYKNPPILLIVRKCTQNITKGKFFC